LMVFNPGKNLSDEATSTNHLATDQGIVHEMPWIWSVSIQHSRSTNLMRRTPTKMTGEVVYQRIIEVIANE
jgi:hypothetical protein